MNNGQQCASLVLKTGHVTVKSCISKKLGKNSRSRIILYNDNAKRFPWDLILQPDESVDAFKTHVFEVQNGLSE